jgi:plastocyanin
MKRTFLSTAAACVLALPALTACEQNRGTRVSGANESVDFWVEPSDTDIVAGEIITFTAHSQDLIGREADIEWTSTAGKVDTEQNGRVARVTFEEPGAYTVTGRVLVEGTVIEDSVDVEVRPIS